MKGLRYFSALMAALCLGLLPVQAQKDITFDFTGYTVQNISNGWNNANETLTLTISAIGAGPYATVGHFYANADSTTTAETYLELNSGSNLTLTAQEGYAFSYLAVTLANGSAMSLSPDQGEFTASPQGSTYEWNSGNDSYVQTLTLTATEVAQISNILVQVQYTKPLDMSAIPIEEGFYFGAPDVHPLYYFPGGYAISDSVFTNSQGVTLSFSGENSPVLAVKRPGSDDDYPALAGYNGEYSMIFTPPTGKTITQIVFDADISEGATVSSGTITGGLYGNTISDDNCTWNGETSDPLTIYVTNLSHTYIEMIQVTLGDAPTPPSADEMAGFINAALNTSVTTTDATLDFNGQGSAQLAEVLMNYYPEGYPLDEMPLTFGSVTMTFSGGAAMLRLAPTGALEIGAESPYVMRLVSTSTMSSIAFSPSFDNGYTMSSSGCYPSLGSGNGDAGSFTDNTWQGSSTDLQIATSENTPSISSIHVAYSATLVQATEVVPNYDESTHTLTLSTMTNGANIYYTLDGTDPTTESTLYTEPLVLTQNIYLRAIAGGDGFENSPILEFQNDDFVVENVTFSYDNQSRQMTLVCNTPHATVFYTLDGTEPTDTLAATRYLGAFLINSASDMPNDLRAFAQRDGFVHSGVSVFSREDNIVAQPQFSRDGNAVTITTTTDAATILYGLSADAAPSLTYTAPVAVIENGILQAQAVAQGKISSDISSFSIDWFQCEAVTFDYQNGMLSMASVSTTSGAQIYYTLDGSEPTNASIAYTDPILLSDGAVVKAIAIRENWEPSTVTVFNLADYQTATPTLTRDGDFVNITCETAGAEIFYVLSDAQYTPQTYDEIVALYDEAIAAREAAIAAGDENIPEVVGGTYTGPIQVTHNGVLYAAAQLNTPAAAPMAASPVASLVISGIQAAPVTFTYDNLRLSMSTTSAGASIFYTTDGSTPTPNSPAYTTPVELTSDCVVQAIAFSALYDESDVNTFNFVLAEHTVSTPQFARTDNLLTITSDTPGATIYYNVNAEATPDENATLYTSPIQIDGSMSVQAVAYASGFYPSAVNIYVASEFQCEPVSFAFQDLMLTLTSATDGATIYYTLDGTVPTTASTAYTAPIPLTVDCTVRAIAVRQGWTASDITAYQFVAADYTVAEPLITRSGDYITITCETDGALIYYSQDNNLPTANDTPYTAPFTPTRNGTLFVTATATGLLPSHVQYDVNWLTTAAVTFTYSYPMLSLNCATADAVIYYTLDGSEPTEQSTVYANPIEVLQNTTVKAIAVRQGYNASTATQYEVNIDANTAAAPVMAREGNTVIITSSTAGATIYYTLDGSDPNSDSISASPIYTEPLTMTRNCVVKALAIANGMANSAVTTFNVDWFQCADVTFTYNARTVELSSTTDGVTIYYTLDGSAPTENSAVYATPLELTSNATVQAMATRQGYTPSAVTTYNFVLADYTCATPQFSRDGDDLTITCTTENVTIYYTTDGSTPTANSAVYTSAIVLDGNMTVKAVASRADLFDSPVASFVANEFKVADVAFTYADLRLTMTTATDGATIYYTTDGSAPTSQSTIYTEPIELTADCVVRAIATRQGWTTSSATTYNFSLAAVTVAAPQFSLQGNELILTTTTAGATIYYTTDGSDPSTQGMPYTNPIHLDGNLTIRAIALRADLYPSAVTTYVASEFKVADVAFTYSGLRLSMTTATEGATIYYTIDGTAPTTQSTVYTGPIELTADCSVRALAVRDSWENSDVTSYDFTLAAVTASAPQFSRNGDQLYITSTTQGAAIYFTLDGSEPTIASTLYTGAIQLDGNGLVRALAVAENYYPSAVSDYQVNWFRVADVDFVFTNLHLTMSTTTAGATIHYTTDGSTPTAASATYQQPIELTQDCVVQAIAVRQNWQDSDVTAYEFSLSNVTADSPVIGREGNTVTITNLTAGTTVYYTTDGSVPTTASTPYTAPFQVTQNGIIRAMATGPNFNPSPVVSYSVDWFQAERVEFAYHELYLEMNTSTANATIYYTLDGSYPSPESQVYQAPILLTEDCDVRAIAVRQGWTTSDVALYHFNRAAVTAPTPQFYRNGNLLSISTGNPNVQVFYTLDGSEPTDASILYEAPLQLTGNVTVRAIALNEERYFPSAINSYVVDWFQVSSVEFALNEMRLSMSTPTADASIFYTLDGTTPTANSVPYVAPLTLTTDADVRAIAIRQSWTDAAVSLFHFNLSSHTAPTPQFRRNGNQLSISTGNPAVSVFYTLDGSEPTAASEAYTAPLELTRNAIVRAIAIGQNYANSAIALYEVDWFRTTGVEFALNGQELTLSTITPDAVIRYTLDGSAPTATSTVYTAPLMLTADTDVRAMAQHEGWTNSEVSLFQFRRANVVAATPNFSRAGNELTITTVTPDAHIFYTLDGTVPTTASTPYTEPIQLTRNGRVSAIAVSDTTLPSGVSTYLVNWFAVDNVVFTYQGGLLAMTTDTPDARIYFTTDGTTPTEQSTRYILPIAIDHSCVVQAIAVLDDLEPSCISSYYFELENPGTVTPVFELVDRILRISCPTPGSTIHYTLDGTMPTELSTVYVSPIQLTRNGTVRAIAVAPGYRTSGVAEFTTDIFRVEDIRAELFEGFLYLTTETPNAVIRYTLDGSVPTAASATFDEPILLEQLTTVKAYGEREGYTTSNLLVVDINPHEERCAQPTFILADRMLTISTITDGATILYSLDGSAPTTPYTGAITLEQNGLVRAVAHKVVTGAHAYLDSDEAQLQVNQFQVDLPAFDVAGADIAISTLTSGATIHYTLDGSTPTTASAVYTAPVSVPTGSSVQAMAVRDNFTASAVATFDPSLSTQAPVTIDYDGHAFTLTAEPSSTIYYTTDGSNPTTLSAVYQGTTPADGLCTIRAIAVRDGSNNANESLLELPAYFDGQTASVRTPGSLSQALRWVDKSTLHTLTVLGCINDADFGTLRSEATSLESLDLKLVSTTDHSLPDRALAASSIVSVELPTDVQSVGQSLFADCHQLAAVIWNAQQPLPAEVFDGVENPNLLLYVAAAGYAPSVIHNVVVGRQAQNIALTDAAADGNFHCPRPFFARQITYAHEYTLQTAIGGQRGFGWETLAVPFNVTRVNHATRGEVVPFGRDVAEDQQLPRFWLREMQADGLVAATTIQAHVPYVIAMPNHPDYADRYILAGRVTFEGQNVTVGVTEPLSCTNANGTGLVANFRRQQAAADILAINRQAEQGYEAGSIFLPQSRDVMPFEAYAQTPDSSPVKLFNDDADAIHDVPAYMLRSNEEGTHQGIHDLSGRRIPGGQLRKGIYIVGGRKVLR